MFKNILNYLTYVPKKAVAITAIALLVLTPMVATASWSPARPTKDWNVPADRTGFTSPVFNSFINTPDYGDERTFFDGRDASIPASTVGGFQEQINVQDGQELVLRTYVHNNANQSLNDSGQGVAHNSKVRVFLPTATDRAMSAISYISADNATPTVVSDTFDFVNETPFKVEYVPGSAKAATNAVPGGYQVADSIVTSGAPIGYTGPNGEIPGCFEFAAIVTFKVKIKAGNFSVAKQVRKVGDADKTWKENVTVNPGDTVEYLIHFKNTSEITLNDVVVGDTLPKHQTFVAGSAVLTNTAFPNGTPMGNDKIVSGGNDIGSYLPGGGAYVSFKAKVDNAEQLACGNQTLTNTAVVQPKDNEAKKDTASVSVAKACKPGEIPPTSTPTQLPNTGIEGPLAGILGSGSLGVAIRSFIRGRRSLKDALISV